MRPYKESGWLNGGIQKRHIFHQIISLPVFYPNPSSERKFHSLYILQCQIYLDKTKELRRAAYLFVQFSGRNKGLNLPWVGGLKKQLSWLFYLRIRILNVFLEPIPHEQYLLLGRREDWFHWTIYVVQPHEALTLLLLIIMGGSLVFRVGGHWVVHFEFMHNNLGEHQWVTEKPLPSV